MKRSPLIVAFLALFLFAGCATSPSWSVGARKEFVGSGCYLVGGTPELGDIDTFETFSAEYIGSGKVE